MIFGYSPFGEPIGRFDRFLGVVVVNVAFLVFVVIACEWMLAGLTLNPTFCSLYGITAANELAQFGVTPRQDIPQFLMIILMGFVVYMLQSGFARKRPICV